MDNPEQANSSSSVEIKYNLSVLMVEDDYINIFMMQRIFEQLFNIVYAKTASEAINLINKNVYDLILMDINLGDDTVTGVDILNLMRREERNKNTKVFAVTGYVQDGDREKYLGFGFDEHFPKPLSKEGLVEAIQKVFPGL